MKGIRQTTGYTLVEMMVASMLGIFLIGGSMTVYLSNKTTYQIRDATSDIESNARIALLAITSAVEHAGYPSIYVHTIDKPFYTYSDGLKNIPICADNKDFSTIKTASDIYNGNITTRDVSKRDQISVIYMPDNPKHPAAIFWKDCGGSYALDKTAELCSSDPTKGRGKDAAVYNSFYVDNNLVLNCTTSRNKTYPIADGIEYIQYLYGVRRSGSTTYKNASDVQADNEWGYVISVQVAMLVRSTEKVKKANDQMAHALLDTNISTNDKYLRKIYSSTIYLKNMDRILSD